MSFVLDNSVAISWVIRSGTKSDLAYADRVLATMESTGVLAPTLWWLEVANVIARAETRGQLSANDSAQFLQLLAALPIEEHVQPGAALLAQTLALARQYGLSAYDATYLDLALRAQTPLASLDHALNKAAAAAGVALYLSEV